MVYKVCKETHYLFTKVLKKIISAFQNYSEYNTCDLFYDLKIEFYKELLKSFNGLTYDIQELKTLKTEEFNKVIEEVTI